MKLNNSAYFMLPFVRDIILLGFAIIKLVNGVSLKTIGGKLFSYGINGTIIVFTLASIFMKFPTPSNVMNIISVTAPIQAATPSTAFGINDPVLNPVFGPNSTDIDVNDRIRPAQQT